MNVSNFFRDLRTTWQRENRTRSEDYLLGGNVALREACGAMMAVNDVVNAELANKQRIQTQQENREVQQRNKELNASLRTLTAKYEKLQSDYAALEVQAKHPNIQVIRNENKVESGLKKRLTDTLAECASLRYRNAQLLALAAHEGKQLVDPNSQTARDKGYILKLEKELDIHRAGTHTVTVARILKFVKNVLDKFPQLTETERWLLLRRQMESYEGIIAGREPDEWADCPTKTNA